MPPAHVHAANTDAGRAGAGNANGFRIHHHWQVANGELVDALRGMDAAASRDSGAVREDNDRIDGGFHRKVHICPISRVRAGKKPRRNRSCNWLGPHCALLIVA